MKDKVATLRKALRPWALGAMCGLAFAAPVAQASLLGQTVTVGFN